jgi:hypothetical protein
MNIKSFLPAVLASAVLAIGSPLLAQRSHEGQHNPRNPAAAAISPEARSSLVALAFAAADAASPLAADNLDAYKEQIPALRAALAAYFAADKRAANGPLAKFKGSPADPASLQAARREFEPLSTAIADLVRANRLHHTEDLRVFECPMTPVLGDGRWLQREAGTKNPFFGSRMLRCGGELDPKSAGHAAPATLYTCPMASHADVVTDKPGTCPKCNMTLAPTSKVKHGSKAEEHWGRKHRAGAVVNPHADVLASLPDGHPPLDAQTIASFFAAPPAKPAAGSCGGCGMSAAAMAAGESCGSDKQ